MLGAGVCSASPPGPGDPGYCGARQDALDCVPQTGPPTPGEAAFINNVRGLHVYGDDAELLKIARGTCNMLLGGVSVNYIVPDIATHLGTTNASANQVMDAAMDTVCPGLRVGADGVARPAN
jgi:hypothetical protein